MIRRGSRCTSIPRRASRYSGTPLRLSAEYIGGTCSRLAAELRQRRDDIGFRRPRARRLIDDVAFRVAGGRRQRRARPSPYTSCGHRADIRTTLVAAPRQTGSMPVASGSKLPACPAFAACKQPFGVLQRVIGREARAACRAAGAPEQSRPRDLGARHRAFAASVERYRRGFGAARRSSMRRLSSTARRALVSWRKRSSGARRKLQRLADARAEEAARLLEASLIGSGSSSRPSVLKNTVARLRSPLTSTSLHARPLEARILDLRQQQLVQQPLDLGGDSDAFWYVRAALVRPGLRAISVRS